MIRFTHVDGVTVARGAIGNPWVFSQARALFNGDSLPNPPSLHEQREVIAQHYQLAEQLYGEERCLAPMRKFGIKYAQLHPQASAVRDAFVQVREAGEWKAVLARWYADDLAGVHPTAEEPNPRSSEAAPSGIENAAAATSASR